MKGRHRDVEPSLVKTFGIDGISAYLIGVVLGYIKGFSADHRSVRWVGRVLLWVSVFAIVCTAVYMTAPVFGRIQKNTETNAAIAQAAEEGPEPAAAEEEIKDPEPVMSETEMEPSQEKTGMQTKAEEEYRKSDGDSIDIPVNPTGLDQTPPQIIDVTIGDFEVSNVDRPVPVTVTISAEDDVTPQHQLTYAFLPEEEKPGEEDWTSEPTFQREITKNGGWTVFCRDEAGNTTTKNSEIIVVDTKPPKVNLTLEKEEWCQENRIFVSAEDSLPVEYRYLCEKTGKDSGWIPDSSITVTENGIWKIQVRDKADNTAEQVITVENIDTQAPVIRGIAKISEGEAVNNEK